MANITGKTLLGAQPADGDKFYLVDVSDTTDNANGSDKSIVYTDLLAAALLKAGGTMSGDIAMGGSNITGGGVITLTEQAAADADVAGDGQIWVKTATPNELWFTDDAGTDFHIATLSDTATETAAGIVELATDAEATTGTDTARAMTPANVKAVTDALTHAPEGTAVLSTGEVGGTKYLREDGDGTSSWQAVAGGGDVTKVGTPVNNEIGVWTGDGTLEGDTNLQWDGSLMNVTGEVDLTHTATANDDHALELIVDAAGFGDVKAIDIAYDTGAVAAGEEEAVVLSNINQLDATGGTVVGHEILVTDGSLDAVYGQKAGAGVGPIEQASGGFANPTTGTNNTASTDVPAMIDGSTGTSTTIFVADNDYIIIGAAAAFTEISFNIQTPGANPGIQPTFGYSTAGAGQFTTFSPVDGTNGFRNTGVVAWDAADLTSHTTNDDTGTYDIKITRTSNTVGSISLYYAVTAATTTYSWDKDGNIVAATLNGGSADQMTVNGAAITSQIAANSDTLATIESHTHSDTAAVGGVFYTARSRGTQGSETIVQSGDKIGQMAFVGYDGTDYATAASIDAEVDGTPGTDDMPGRLVFNVSADGGQTLTEKMRIGNDGDVTLASPGNNTGSVLTTDDTQTLTNKTFDANGTGNSLSNVDIADLANGTDGELITWDAAGAPAAVAVGTATHVLTSNGVGAAPTFQAAAGGGAFTPMITHQFASGYTDAGSYNSQLNQNSGTGSGMALDAYDGWKMDAGTTSTGYARLRMRSGKHFTDTTDNMLADFWDRDMYVTCQLNAGTLGTAGCYQDLYLGIGDMDTDVSGMGGAIEAAGLWISTSNGTLTWYIHTNDGTTETKTDITTAVQAITRPPNPLTNGLKAFYVALVWDSGTSFTIYINGEQVGQTTSNLPTGSMPEDYYLQCVLASTTSNTYSSDVFVNWGKFEYPAY
jgi:YD repeat-containing protein